MTKVLIFGAFDGLHQGHIEMLKQAKALGDYLVVLVSPDKVVKKLKDKAPKHKSGERIQGLKNLHLADEVVLGDEDIRTWSVLKRHKPNIIALGYDQDELKLALEAFLAKSYPDIQDPEGGWQNNPKRPNIVILNSFHPEKYKSSLIQ